MPDLWETPVYGLAPPNAPKGTPLLGQKKSPWKRAGHAFRLEAKEFCLVTGWHGYKYIVQPGKHRAERFFWILVVTVSMVAAVFLMLIAYDFNRQHPTIQAVDTTHYPLWSVDAPAVTVCPSNKVFRSKALRLIRTLVLPDGVTEEDMLTDIAMLVELVAPRSDNTSKFIRLQGVLDNNSLGVDHVLKQVSPTCDELLVRCIWKRRECFHCSDIFRQVRTAYGYCCSFNYMDRELDTHRFRMGGCVGVSYRQVQRLSACGYTNGLSVTMRIDTNEYLTSFLASKAGMILIHKPTQYPDANADLKVVGAGTVSFISYLAHVTQASERLRSRVSFRARKCLFEDETYLPMFRAYNFENCMASCIANFTVEKCGCIPITYPDSLNRRICNLMDTPCVASLTTGPMPPRVPINVSTCPLCHPLCENVKYLVETSVGVLNLTNPASGEALVEGLVGNEEQYALFHVFANDLVTTKYKMDVYMTREDLLGALGGLSGLFVGFSLVSGFEFVYFFTIRPFFRMRARRAASREASQASSARLDAHRGSLGTTPTKPFPLAAPHVFRLRRRAAEQSTAQDDEDGRDISFRRKAANRSMIPVIE